MIEAVRSIPGVTAVGAVRETPMSWPRRVIPVYRPGTTEFTPENHALTTHVYPMSPEYLKAAGTRLLEGRDVSWQDRKETPPVAIVNETFARTMWGDTRAIGQRFVLWERSTEVVGVVEDGKYYNLMESPAAAVFVPLAQDAGERGPGRAVVAAADGDRRGAAPDTGPRPAERAGHAADLARGAGSVCFTRPGRLRSRWASWDSSP